MSKCVVGICAQQLKTADLGNTVEPRFNEPLYNDVLGITNDIFQPSNSVMYGEEARYNESISPVPCHFDKSRFHCNWSWKNSRKTLGGGGYARGLSLKLTLKREVKTSFCIQCRQEKWKVKVLR